MLVKLFKEKKPFKIASQDKSEADSDSENDTSVDSLVKENVDSEKSKQTPVKKCPVNNEKTRCVMSLPFC